MPEVSVVMLTYNREKLVSRAIESVLAQTFTDFEFIIINNGSTDCSGDIATDFAVKDNRIKVIHLNKASSIGSGRNLGLDNVIGKYVAFIDDDDWCELDFLEFLYGLLTKNGADVSVCGAYDRAYDEKQIMNTEDALIELLWRKKIHAAFPTKMFKRELGQLIRFPEDDKFDDISQMYKLIAHANKIAYHGLPKYMFYKHESNNSAWVEDHSLIDHNTLDEYLRAYRVRTEWLISKFSSNAKTWQYFEWAFMISMVEKIYRLKISGCESQLKEMIEKLQENRALFLGNANIQDFEKEWFEKYL